MKQILSIFIVVLLVSCKKDKLMSEKSIFIGKWQWVKTKHAYGWCQNNEQIEYLTPQSENTTYALEFFKKGKMHSYQNNNILNKQRIVFEGFYNALNNATYFDFSIKLNNNSDQKLNGFISSDTLIIIKGFPFSEYEEGCESTVNYFIRA